MTAPDYEAALAGCARGDRAALRRLYETAAPLLLAVALRIVKRRDLADDVVHDAFLDIWQRAASFDRQRGAGRAWVVSVVRHRAFKLLRRGRRETGLDQEAHSSVADAAPDALSALAASQEGAALHRCLGELPRERRDLILLAYVDGLSQSEMAERTGAPLGTVKAWIRRSLLALKACLS